MPNLKLVEPNDEWIDFHVPASDTKGHSARQYFRCIPAMSRQVEQVIQSNHLPYRTKGDLLRHALHRHMNWLSTIADVPSVSGQVNAILEIMRDEEMNSDFTLVFTKLDERIHHHRAAGETNEALRLVLVVMGHIRDMPDGFWKRKYTEKMKSKYGDLVAKADRCKLTLEDD